MKGRPDSAQAAALAGLGGGLGGGGLGGGDGAVVVGTDSPVSVSTPVTVDTPVRQANKQQEGSIFGVAGRGRRGGAGVGGVNGALLGLGRRRLLWA